jgi:hypothetical protein
MLLPTNRIAAFKEHKELRNSGEMWGIKGAGDMDPSTY